MTPPGPDVTARRPTIYDVAREAAVSHQTVSRFLKGQDNIRADLRERIEHAVRKLDYRPNATARSLATRRSVLIGALLYGMSELGPSRSAQGAAEGAREAGYFLDMMSVDPGDPATIDRAIALIRERELAGLLIQAPTDGMLERVDRFTFDWPVLIEREPEFTADAAEPSHNGVGVTMLMEHLYGLGHRRFHHISGPLDWISARNRRTAYEQALAGSGLESSGMTSGDWSAASGYHAVMSIPHVRFTAVVAGNDQMALGAMRALYQRRLSVPADVSVVGFDDLPEAAFFQPPLTTIAQNFRAQGRLAIEELLHRIDGSSLASTGSMAPVLRIRDSTAPPPAT
jgi:DNA-binding LacI/PurR family transcriptional regulator